MIFQNPRTALNPIRPVGRQIGDVLLRHADVARADAASAGRSTCWRRSSIPDPGAPVRRVSVRAVRAACASA